MKVGVINDKPRVGPWIPSMDQSLPVGTLVVCRGLENDNYLVRFQDQDHHDWGFRYVHKDNVDIIDERLEEDPTHYQASNDYGPGVVWRLSDNPTPQLTITPRQASGWPTIRFFYKDGTPCNICNHG